MTAAIRRRHMALWEREYKTHGLLHEWETRQLARVIASTVPVGKGKRNPLAQMVDSIHLFEDGEMKTASQRDPTRGGTRDQWGRTFDENIFEEPDASDSGKATGSGVEWNQLSSVTRLFRMRNAPILGPGGLAVRQTPRTLSPADPAPRREGE